MASTSLAILKPAERDPIDRHFDIYFALMDRPKRLGDPPPRPYRGTKAFSVASLRGKGMYPSPVGVAEFAGGEKIRMSFWQDSRKPYRAEAIQHWLCRIIGNERGRAGKAHAEGREILRRKLDAARALQARPGSVGEGAAATRAVKRLEKAAMEEAFDAMAIFSRVYPPATDLVSFHIEHDGKRVNLPAVVSLSNERAKRRIDVSKNYDVTIKWHTPADATVRETVVKTWASSAKLAEKLALRGARLDGTLPADAIIDPAFPGTALDKVQVEQAAESPTVAAVVNIKSPEPIPALDRATTKTTTQVDLDRADIAANRARNDRAEKIAKLEAEFGPGAVDAFFDAMTEFSGSKRAGEWDRSSRLWITVAKIAVPKRRAA